MAASTLELALSKLEGLARTVSDSGVNKDAEVQRALEESEDAYLAAKKRFGYDETLDPAAAEDLVKRINQAESVAKRVSVEQQHRARAKETLQERVSALVARLATVSGMCDASGPLVAERVGELVGAARASVNTAVRTSLNTSSSLLATQIEALQRMASASGNAVVKNRCRRLHTSSSSSSWLSSAFLASLRPLIRS